MTEKTELTGEPTESAVDALYKQVVSSIEDPSSGGGGQNDSSGSSEATSGQGEDKPKAEGTEGGKDETKPDNRGVSGDEAGTKTHSEESSNAGKTDGGKPKVGAGEKPEPDDFDSVELPSNVSRKAADAFNQIKQRARETISKLTERVKELEAKVSEEPKDLPEEVKSRLEQAEKILAAHQVETHPFWTPYRERIQSLENKIYGLLKEAGLPEDAEAKIKEHGGPLSVDLDPILEQVTQPKLRRSIEHNLVALESAADEFKSRLAKAKEEATSFLAEQSQRVRSQVDEELRKVLDTADWYKSWEGEERKKLLAEARKLAGSTDPTVQAALLAGALKLNRVQGIVRELDEKVVALTKERDSLAKQLEEIKKSSARARTTAATQVDEKPKSESIISSEPTGVILDKLFAEVTGESVR
jgi:BMFP domain-containing protein YqiC